MRVQIIIPNLTPVNSCLQESRAPAFRWCPLRWLLPPLLRPQTWRQSILVSKNHALLHSVDARSGGCSSRSGGRAPLRRLRPVLGADRSVISKLELGVVACGGPGVGHTGRPIVYSAMCVPKRARATADQAKKQWNTDIEEHDIRYRIKKLWHRI
jgi:hypothetical protein